VAENEKISEIFHEQKEQTTYNIANKQYLQDQPVVFKKAVEKVDNVNVIYIYIYIYNLILQRLFDFCKIYICFF